MSTSEGPQGTNVTLIRFLFSWCSVGRFQGQLKHCPAVAQSRLRKYLLHLSHWMDGRCDLCDKKKNVSLTGWDTWSGTRTLIRHRLSPPVSGTCAQPVTIETCDWPFVFDLYPPSLNSCLTSWKSMTRGWPWRCKILLPLRSSRLEKKTRFSQRQQIFNTNRKCPTDRMESGGKACIGPPRDHIV